MKVAVAEEVDHREQPLPICVYLFHVGGQLSLKMVEDFFRGGQGVDLVLAVDTRENESHHYQDIFILALQVHLQRLGHVVFGLHHHPNQRIDDFHQNDEFLFFGKFDQTVRNSHQNVLDELVLDFYVGVVLKTADDSLEHADVDNLLFSVVFPSDQGRQVDDQFFDDCLVFEAACESIDDFDARLGIGQV